MNGDKVLAFLGDLKDGKSAFTNDLLDHLYGFHDFSTDNIEWPEDQAWEDEEFGDLLMETFDFGSMTVGNVMVEGNDVRCHCVHEIEQVISDEHGQDIEKIKFFVVAFQCDVVLVAMRGFAFETFQDELTVYLTHDGDSWRAGTVVNGYLGEMSGDLKSSDDEDFFDD